DRPDGAYLTLVKQFIPTGLKGLILAGVAAALMSTLSAVLNSASTIVTIDLYRKFRTNRSENDRREVIVGQISGMIMLVCSTLAALEFLRESRSNGNIVSLFVLIQNIFFYIAPPFAVIFTLGLLWRRGTGKAALITIVSGFAFTVLLERVIFPNVRQLAPY